MIQYPELIICATNFGIRRVRLLAGERIESVSAFSCIAGAEWIESQIDAPYAFCRYNDGFFFVPHHNWTKIVHATWGRGDCRLVFIDTHFDSDPNWHEACRVNDVVFFVSSIFGVVTYSISESRFVPIEWPFENDPKWHINSVAWHDDLLWLNYHNYGSKYGRQSFVKTFCFNDGRALEQKHIIKGIDTHSLVVAGKYGLIMLSSHESKVLGVDSDFEIDMKPSAYLRGMAYRDGRLYIGRGNPSIDRARRGEAAIEVYNLAEMKSEGIWKLPPTVAIQQIAF